MTEINNEISVDLHNKTHKYSDACFLCQKHTKYFLVLRFNIGYCNNYINHETWNHINPNKITHTQKIWISIENDLALCSWYHLTPLPFQLYIGAPSFELSNLKFYTLECGVYLKTVGDNYRSRKEVISKLDRHKPEYKAYSSSNIS